MSLLSIDRFQTMCENAAQRGDVFQEQLLTTLNARLGSKRLPDLGIERAAQLAGCTAAHIRNLEAQGRLPAPRTVIAGSIERRVYNYNEINIIRSVCERAPQRPAGSQPCRVVFSNLKGGVAKTTLSLHFSQYVARQGYRVLLVDADPQATATGSFGIIPDLDLGDDDDLTPALLLDPTRIRASVRATHWSHLKLLPARLALQCVDWALSQPEQRDNPKLGPPAVRLSRALACVEDDYDIIVIDTPPSLGMLSINAIAAASLIIMPIVPHMYDIASSTQYFKLLDQVCRLHPHEINCRRLAILLSKVDHCAESRENIGLINRMYGELLLSHVLLTTREMQKAGSDLQTVYEIETPRGSRDTYLRAVEMLEALNQEILLLVRQHWQSQQLDDLQAQRSEADKRSVRRKVRS